MASIRTLDQIQSDINRVQGKLDALNRPFTSSGISPFGSTNQMSLIMAKNAYEVQLEMYKAEKDAVQKYQKNISDCVDIDKQIKLLDVDITNKSKERLTAKGNRVMYLKKYVEVATAIRSNFQEQFVREDCASKIENKKALETAGIIGKEIEKYEKDVLFGSDKERKQLFIIGGVVLLIALGVILYANKKK